MAVVTAATVIRTLHRIQRQLTDLRSQLAAGPKQIAAQMNRLKHAEHEQEQVAEDLTKARKHADEKQLLLRSSEAKINDLEAKRNTAKTNREYQLLGEQIEADKMAIKVLEDEILESLERVDEINGHQPVAAVEKFKKVSEELETLKQQVKKETHNSKKKLLVCWVNSKKPNATLPTRQKRYTNGSSSIKVRMEWQYPREDAVEDATNNLLAKCCHNF